MNQSVNEQVNETINKKHIHISNKSTSITSSCPLAERSVGDLEGQEAAGGRERRHAGHGGGGLGGPGGCQDLAEDVEEGLARDIQGPPVVGRAR